ncbi:hypothetical protein LguiA_035836 [Lonicera macranthoides]
MSTDRAWEGTRSSGFSRAAGGAPDTTRRAVLLPAAGTLPPAEPFPGWAGC